MRTCSCLVRTEPARGWSHERFTPFATLLAKHPERIIEKAVYGMLPKTALGRGSLRGKLRVYAGAEHPHASQQPKTLTFSKSEAK